LEQTFLGSGAQHASNIQCREYGDMKAFGMFNGGGFGICAGVVISTGDVMDFNKDLPQKDFGSTGAVNDDIGFEMKFSMASPATLSFRYVFASRELPEYMGQKYNDDFKLTLNGVNIARLPDGQPVTINNLGRSKTNVGSWHSSYRNNTNGQFFKGYTGFTQVLTAQGTISQTFITNTLNVSVTDVGDGLYDSVIFLEGGSFSLQNYGTMSKMIQNAAQEEQGQSKPASTSDSSLVTILVPFICATIVLAMLAAAGRAWYRHSHTNPKATRLPVMPNVGASDAQAGTNARSIDYKISCSDLTQAQQVQVDSLDEGSIVHKQIVEPPGLPDTYRLPQFVATFKQFNVQDADVEISQASDTVVSPDDVQFDVAASEDVSSEAVLFGGREVRLADLLVPRSS
jgi:hypothetical protein